jgi:hypothetical protein
MVSLRAILTVALLLIAGVAHADPVRQAALERTLANLWFALSNDPGKPADIAALRTMFHPEARILGLNPDARNKALRVQTLEGFLSKYAQPSAEGFYELEIYRAIEIYDTWAHVLCTVESRKNPNDAKPMAVAVNSLQLVWLDGGWRIVSLYYHLENPLSPIPPRYRIPSARQ